MKTFIDPNLLQRPRVGPLAPYLDAYLKVRSRSKLFLALSVHGRPLTGRRARAFTSWLQPSDRRPPARNREPVLSSAITEIHDRGAASVEQIFRIVRAIYLV